jgi:hypothetical protein
MNVTTKNLGTLITAGFLMGFLSLSHATPILDVTYDFGTDPGKTTFEDAGFTKITSGDTFVSNVADGVHFGNPDLAARNNVGIFRQFTGLGTTLTNNFTITTTLTYDTLATNANNNRPGGITLFAAENNLQSGINLRILQTSTVGTDTLHISRGLDVANLATQTWTGDIAQGDVLTFTVVGTFNTIADSLLLEFTATRGVQSQTLNYTVADFSSSVNIAGNYFGLASRINGGVITEADTFSVNVIPEPSTLALLGIALGSLVLFRRRK